MPGENDLKIREMASETLVRAARDLRRRETTAEARLWACLRDRRLAGLKFRRQHPVAGIPFIADFLCYDHRLIVELDGGIHQITVAEDRARQADLEEAGYHVIRFPNERIFTDLENVLREIILATRTNPAQPRLSQPSP